MYYDWCLYSVCAPVEILAVVYDFRSLVMLMLDASGKQVIYAVDMYAFGFVILLYCYTTILDNEDED